MSGQEYDPNRRDKTWREEHPYTKRTRALREKTANIKRKNRGPGQFGKVNWDAYQHDQLYDMIMRANIGDMSTRAGQWHTLAAKIDGTTGDVQKVMERVMGSWRGEAAVSSAESNTRLMAWAGEASTTASTIADGMSTYTEAVTRAQNHMPEPAFADAERNFRNGYTVVGTGGPSTAVLLDQLLSDGMVSHQQARERKAEAVAVMESYESQSKDVHDSMPHFSDPEPTTDPDVESWSPSPYADTPAPGPTPQPTPTPTPGPGVGTDPGSSTTAAGFVDPTLPGLNGGPGSAGGGPGSTGYGGYGGGLGSLGSGGSDIVRNAPGLGGFAGGGPFAAGRGVPGAAGVLGGRGAGAAGGFGGMPLGGAAGEEDKEHKNKYDEGLDFFDDLPPAYPPVFGA